MQRKSWRKKWPVSDDFGVRSPVIQKPFVSDEKWHLYRSMRHYRTPVLRQSTTVIDRNAQRFTRTLKKHLLRSVGWTPETILSNEGGHAPNSNGGFGLVSSRTFRRRLPRRLQSPTCRKNRLRTQSEALRHLVWFSVAKLETFPYLLQKLNTTNRRPINLVT